MRFLRFMLWFVAIGAAVVWLIGYVREFRGFTCVELSHTCSNSQDLRFQWHVVLWVAPLVSLVSVGLLMVSRHSRSGLPPGTKRPVAQRQPLVRQVLELEQGASPADDRPGDGARDPGQPENPPADPAPRHAAKDSFVTLYDPATSKPRHAAPEPDPEW
jgi:hypothetical protein